MNMTTTMMVVMAVVAAVQVIACVVIAVPTVSVQRKMAACVYLPKLARLAHAMPQQDLRNSALSATTEMAASRTARTCTVECA